MKKWKWKRFQSYLLCTVCTAALLVPPGTAYGTEEPIPQNTAHTHQPECRELICGLTETSEEGTVGNGGESQDTAGVASPSVPQREDTESGQRGHRHTSECYRLNCPYESGQSGANSLAMSRQTAGNTAENIPRFTKDLPDQMILYRGQSTFTLEVEAEAEGDPVTYEWHQAYDSAGTMESLVTGEENTYTGERDVLNLNMAPYFYAVAINTVTGETKRSNIIQIIPTDLERMVLDESEIVDASYTQGEAAKALRVDVTTASSGSLSYLWYQRKEGAASGSPIRGANSSSYTPPTSQAGLTSYYVVVTNQIGSLKEEITSREATIIVKSASKKDSGPDIKKTYNTPYEAKKAVEEMLANRIAQLKVTDSSLSQEWLTVLTDFDMTALLKKAEAQSYSGGGDEISVMLPSDDLSGSLTGQTVKTIEYRLTLPRAIWEGGQTELEILLDKEFLQNAGKNRDIRILCVDENGKGMYGLILTGKSIAEMETSKTGIFNPNYSGNEVKIRLVYYNGNTMLAEIEGFDYGILGFETPVN